MWEKFDINLLSNVVSITSSEADFSRYAAAYEREAIAARRRLF
jgi:hypothetical protein